MINECECSRKKALQNSVRKSSVLVNLPRISAPLDWKSKLYMWTISRVPPYNLAL